MPIESAADRAAFVNPDEFGVMLRYLVPGRASAFIAGVLDMPTRDVLAGDIGVSASGAPRVLIRAADLPKTAAPGENTPDRVMLDGVTYEPRLAEPDGTGMLTLTLEEVG
jgi:hypothetical protein